MSAKRPIISHPSWLLTNTANRSGRANSRLPVTTFDTLGKSSSTTLTQVAGLSSIQQEGNSRGSLANTLRSGCRILPWNAGTKKADPWLAYNRFFEDKTGTFGTMKDNYEKYLCSSNQIAWDFRKTFLEARQLQQETFNWVHEAHVNAAVVSSNFFDTSDNDPLFEDFSECALVCALKSCSRSSCFDNDQIHPKMLQNVGVRFITIILRLFNMWPQEKYLALKQL